MFNIKEKKKERKKEKEPTNVCTIPRKRQNKKKGKKEKKKKKEAAAVKFPKKKAATLINKGEGRWVISHQTHSLPLFSLVFSLNWGENFFLLNGGPVEKTTPPHFPTPPKKKKKPNTMSPLFSPPLSFYLQPNRPLGHLIEWDCTHFILPPFGFKS